MITLDSVSCGDDYTAAATLGPVFGSAGGSFFISGNDAYVQLSYGRQGQAVAMTELHVATGAGQFLKGVIAARFRNKSAGKVAVVSATLSNAGEPVFTLGGFGGA